MEDNNIPSSVFRRPLPFDLSDSQTKSARWEKWIRCFERYLRLTCGNYSDEMARDLFLNLVGDDVEDLLVTFPPESIATYKGLIKCLTDSFVPQRNVDNERYTFNMACQRADESLDDFATRLRKLVLYCEFDKFNNEEAIKLGIIEGCHSTRFRTKILKETYTLDKILAIARSEGRTTSHAINLENGRTRTMQQVHSKAGGSTRHDMQTLPLTKSGKACYRCGLAYPHVGACPAMGQKCQKCNRDNHHASVCRDGHIKSDRRWSTRPRKNSSHRARPMEACNLSPFADSEYTSVRETN